MVEHQIVVLEVESSSLFCQPTLTFVKEMTIKFWFWSIVTAIVCGVIVGKILAVIYINGPIVQSGQGL